MSTELIFETYIRASAEQVWKAITSPAFTSQYFFGTSVESSWRPGDTVRYLDSPDGKTLVKGEVLTSRPPFELSISWHVLYDETASGEPPSRVRFTIEKLNDQCRLRIVHDEFPTNSVIADNVRSGWPWILASLKSLLETGTALPVRKTHRE